mmetsp:Transcript_6819/g.13998  ORF Transcript_6819/g.13998 Transcript_6819/m.13998 type:complete len:360 (-) Transcript_6819:755-1834(-)
MLTELKAPDGLEVDPSAPVLVTGASGYIAGHLVKLLLEQGFTVHATVRDISVASTKYRHLSEIAERTSGTLRFFQADLVDQGSFAAAIAGCSVVFHIASPCKLDVADPRRDLFDPAVGGTRNVLEEANRTETVRRVVLTSSTAAIYSDIADCEDAPGGVLTEEVWNTTASLDDKPYFFSKTWAEKEAWSIAEAQTRWDLVVLNPAFVIGPAIGPHASSESFSLIKTLATSYAIPRFSVGVVDVREVVYAHFVAAFLPHAKGRYILAREGMDMFDLAQLLRPKFGKLYPGIPRMVLPKWLACLVIPFVVKGTTRKDVERGIGFAWRVDNSKGIRDLGVSYRPIEESINEMFQYMIDTQML